MADESAANRWWENYLVRYFLPSIVGMLIVAWLQQNTGANRYLPGFYIYDWKIFNTPYLVLWLLIGTLYCYVASYPALVFHATRILDFKDVLGRIWGGKRLFINPYVASFILAFLGGVCYFIRFITSRFSTEYSEFIALWLPIALSIIIVGSFSFLQVWRIWKVLNRFGDFGLREINGKADASIAYAYVRFLAERRGVTRTDATGIKAADEDEGMKRDTEKDIVETYRHLREHGNTALIVLLELALCPILCLILGDTCYSRSHFILNVSHIDVLLSVVLILWVLPSVCIHGFAQHLEHRFSWFKYSIIDGKNSSQIDEQKYIAR
jgi:hypothetical protein